MRYTTLSALFWLPACMAMPGGHKPDILPAARQPKLEHEPLALHAPRRALNLSRDDSDGPGLLAKAGPSDIEKARAIVEAALEQAAERNAARLAHPMRNKYTLNPKTNMLGKRDISEEDVPPPPLFNITGDIREAAALMAEFDAQEKAGNSSTSRISAAADPGKWWMGNLQHSGGWPWGKNKGGYKVFRNVKDYNATGNGKTDDTKAIQNAVRDFEACGPGCYSSTTKGAIIYFPPGEYLISSTIETYYGTQFIGDAVDRPTLVASKFFVGLGVISTNHYVPDGGTGSDGLAKQWFINTANFYRQIRNFKINIKDTFERGKVAAIHYQVAQATSLQNVDFIMSESATTTQQGIFAENGSGGFMSDLTFTGGAFGIFGGNQQFTSHRLTFNNVRTAIQLIWDWGWVWKSLRFNNCGVAFKLIGESDAHNTGSVMVVDSIFKSVKTAFLTYPYTGTKGNATTGITLDNVVFDGVTNGVYDGEKSYLDGSEGKIDTWVQGRVYSGTDTQFHALSAPFETRRDKTLVMDNPDNLPKAPFFEKRKPQYTDAGADSFVHMKDFCSGDGKTDDTLCFGSTLLNHKDSIVYIDAGTYLVSDTIFVPPGSRIVGENWAQVAARGKSFEDDKSPKPLIRVGNSGDVGNVEIQDLIFTSKGNTPGVIFVEWNIRAGEAGSAGMWDTHVRVGGAAGTELESNQCPASMTGTNDGCHSGFAMMHVTPGSSGYFENVWLWIADHDIDDKDWADDSNFMTQCSVYCSRGILVESTSPTWLYGTSSEHAVLYQYEFNKARHLYANMLQSESPYYQPNPKPPKPVENSLGVWKADPSYNCDDKDGGGCDASWAVIMQECEDVTIHGAGLYSWFSTYKQDCLVPVDCQKSLVKMQKNQGRVSIHNLVTIGSVNMISDDGKIIDSKSNLAVDFHPRWSQIAVYDSRQSNSGCKGEVPNENPKMPEGDFFANRIENEGPEHTWFTIANGTPYKFKMYRAPHNHQLRDWDKQWVDIPAGESLQVQVEFCCGSVYEDTAGEAYFELEGTDKRFQVSVDWDDDKWPGVRTRIIYDGIETRDVKKGTTWDLDWPGLWYGATQQWTLAGDEDVGYLSSAEPPVSWMSSILDVIGDWKLKHVCMPGSHDAGMSKIDGHTAHSDWGNTQTQWLDLYGQLVRGSRWLDIRPCLGNGGKQHLCHYSENVVKSGTQGANGIKVDESIEMINRFMKDHPGELVILDLNNECGFDSDNRGSDPSNNYPRLTDEQWAPIWKKFRDGFDKPCNVGNPDDLTDLTLNDYIGDGQGCVLVVARSIGGVDKDQADPSKGFYHVDSFPSTGKYSETSNYKFLAEDQISRLTLNRAVLGPDNKENNDAFFVLHWETTMEASDIITTIAEKAASTQSGLFWYAYSKFTPLSYPNVIFVDFVGQPFQLQHGESQDEYMKETQNHLIGLALSVNLGLAKLNCHVTGEGE